MCSESENHKDKWSQSIMEGFTAHQSIETFNNKFKQITQCLIK